MDGDCDAVGRGGAAAETEALGAVKVGRGGLVGSEAGLSFSGLAEYEATGLIGTELLDVRGAARTVGGSADRS
jgi:hypothetical protein